MLIKDISKFGLFRDNPHADPINNLKFSTKSQESETTSVGQDTIVCAGADSDTLESVTYTKEGVDYVMYPENTIVATDTDAVFNFIFEKVLRIYEVDAYLDVSYDAASSGTVTVVHIGEGSISAIKLAGETEDTATRLTTVETVATYRLDVASVAATVDAFSDGVDSVAVGVEISDITAITADNASEAAQLKSALVSTCFAGLTDTTLANSATVEVTPDMVTGLYIVKISVADTYDKTMSLTLGGTIYNFAKVAFSKRFV